MIRIFVGCSPNHEDAESQAVLEYTIRKNATAEVDIQWMKLSRNSDSPLFSDSENNMGWITSSWATPFSCFRWAVPELAGFHGRAIYTDSDVIVKADINELWSQPMDGKVALAKGDGSWRYCVSLWDCEKAKKHVWPIARMQRDPSAHSFMNSYFSSHKELTGAFSGNWNCLDGEDYKSLDDPDIKAIHYTAMANQPHLKYAVPRLEKLNRKHWFDGRVEPHFRKDLQRLFDELLTEAEMNGYLAANYCTDEIFGDFPKRSLTHYRGGRRVA